MSLYGSAQQPQGSVTQAARRTGGGEEEEEPGEREMISMRECVDRHVSQMKDARCGSRMRCYIMPAGEVKRWKQQQMSSWDKTTLPV